MVRQFVVVFGCFFYLSDATHDCGGKNSVRKRNSASCRTQGICPLIIASVPITIASVPIIAIIIVASVLRFASVMASGKTDGQKDLVVATIVEVDSEKAKVEPGNVGNAMVLHTGHQDSDEQPLKIENSGSRSPLRSALVEKVQKAMADRLFRVFVKVFVRLFAKWYLRTCEIKLLVYGMFLLVCCVIAVGSTSF